MSANIYYHQVKPIKGQEVPTPTPSHFMEMMRRVFGHELPELGENDIPKLEALSDAFSMESHKINPFRTLLNAVKKYGKIKLYAEY